MDNRGLLTVIVVLLIGILGVMVYKMNHKPPIENAADSVGQAVENMADHIDNIKGD